MKLLAEWFWIERWDGSRAPLLTMEAQGIYRAMLSQAWRRGAVLPNNEEEIQLLIRVRPKEWKRSWPAVKPFWVPVGDTLVNETQAEIYADALGRSERAQARAQAGAQASAQARAQAQHKQSPPSPSPSPGKTHGPTTTRGPKKIADVETRQAIKAAVTELSELTGVDYNRTLERATNGILRTRKKRCEPCLDLDRISEAQAARTLLDVNTAMAVERDRIR